MEQKLPVENGRAELAIGVYVSSTWLDLRPEREAVEEVLHRFQTTKFVGMEYFGASPIELQKLRFKRWNAAACTSEFSARGMDRELQSWSTAARAKRDSECFVYCQPSEACDGRNRGACGQS